MRVICIENIENKARNTGNLVTVPKLLDIDEVIGTRMWRNEELYLLKRFGKDLGFSKHQFIPLSEIDEIELVKERELVTN